MTISDDGGSWASEVFGGFDLGDKRRTKRLVSIARSLERSPCGSVMASIADPAKREGAFRFLASEKFSFEDLGDGLSKTTLARCSGLTYCPIDQASICLSDVAGSRDIGAIGTWQSGARGLHAITMLAADDRGVPIGVLGPQWWARTERSLRQQFKGVEHLPSETWHVVRALYRVETTRRELGSNAQLWFQLDRGFDAWQVLEAAHDLGLLLTVRSSSTRRIRTATGRGDLYSTVTKAPVLGTFAIQIPERPDRPSREATLTVRTAKVRIDLHRLGQNHLVPMCVVYAVEEGSNRADRLHWVLLTTAEVCDFISARAVVFGYTTRWLIEELHRTWKSGWTNVERTQLRRQNSLFKWATLHLALASRAIRLARLSRTEPDRPSTSEFSTVEIEAILLLNRRATATMSTIEPTLKELVLLLAELGGYDRYSRKPPGPTVIGRGLNRIASLAEGLGLLKERSD